MRWIQNNQRVLSDPVTNLSELAKNDIYVNQLNLSKQSTVKNF